MAKARNLNNNHSVMFNYNIKPEDETENHGPSESLFEKKQNDLNAKEDNTTRNNNHYENSYRRQKGRCCCSKRMVIGFLVVSIVLGFATSFLTGKVIYQGNHLESLQNENAILKAQIESLRNETVHQKTKIITCEKELEIIRHKLEVSDAKCSLEKTNLTNHFQRELQGIREEKEVIESNLGDCEREKTQLKQDFKAELEAQRQKMDQCEREKNQLTEKSNQLSNYLATLSAKPQPQCPPCRSSVYSSERNAGSFPNNNPIFLVAVTLLMNLFQRI